MFDAINLDDRDEVELGEIQRVLSELATYAATKREALAHRKVGRIQSAVAREQYCERIYQNLPEWARW